jgi:hypothetical protein
MLIREAFMTTSSTPEDTIAECKRRVDECYALLESTIVPEYRQAISAMAKAWMKIAQSEGKIQANQGVGSARLLANVVEVECAKTPGTATLQTGTDVVEI